MSLLLLRLLFLPEGLLRAPLAAADAFGNLVVKLAESQAARFRHLGRLVRRVLLKDLDALRRLDGAKGLCCLVPRDRMLVAILEQLGQERDGIQPLHLPKRIRNLMPQQHRRRAVEERDQVGHGGLVLAVAEGEDVPIFLAAALTRLRLRLRMRRIQRTRGSRAQEADAHCSWVLPVGPRAPERSTPGARPRRSHTHTQEQNR